MTRTAGTGWNASLYDEKHAFVSRYGEDLVELLHPEPGERILDLGCGTGHLADRIAASGAVVTGIDTSPEMIARAKAQYPHLEMYQRSATDFYFDKPFDAIFSNATLHWVLRKEDAIDCIFSNLKPGGRFVMEMGGKGNVAGVLESLRSALNDHGYAENAGRQLWYFPSVGEYATLLERRGFRVVYATHFDRPTELADPANGIIDFLKMFAGGYFSGIPAPEAESICREVQERIRPAQFRNGHWFADYRRLRVMALKNE